MSDSTDRNCDFIKQEVTRLQDMLNRLDFKRKVGRKSRKLSLRRALICASRLPSGDPVKDGRGREGDRRPDDLSAQSGAAGLEEEAADRRHRRAAANWSGAAAELVRTLQPEF